jgi:type IV secretory pathway component VirB8
MSRVKNVGCSLFLTPLESFVCFVVKINVENDRVTIVNELHDFYEIN